MQVVRPTTEGKVIKVVDGKSMEMKKPVNDKASISGSRKKIWFLLYIIKTLYNLLYCF